MIVQCSWKVADGRPITNAVIWTAETESTNIEDDVTAENCLLLETPDKGEGACLTIPACQLLISTQAPKQIVHISLLSEARGMEIYGHHGEYLKTVRNELLEEDEEMVVYRGDIFLDKPLTLCSIKFLGLRSQTEMWLFGVRINVAILEIDPQNQMTIPFAAVEQRLAEMGLSLSDKAEAFKHLVDKYQHISQAPTDITQLIASLQLSNLLREKSPLPQTAQHNQNLQINAQRDSQNNMQEIVGKLGPCISTSMSTSPVNFPKETNSTQTEEYINLEERLKEHIREQMEEMDKKMWEKINKRFQETEAKILCKLDEIESFVKPQGIANS